jgi:hypothetical protein
VAPQAQVLMQSPHAIGGYRMPMGAQAPAMVPLAQAPMSQYTTGTPATPSTQAPGSAPASMSQQAPGGVPAYAPGPSASNMYADYLKNQQATLNGYLSGKQ